MKQLFAIAMTLVLTCTLCACGKKNEETQPSTTLPIMTQSTTSTTAPAMDPSMETNVPDPSVDTSTPDMTDLLPSDGSNGSNGGSGDSSNNGSNGGNGSSGETTVPSTNSNASSN